MFRNWSGHSMDSAGRLYFARLASRFRIFLVGLINNGYGVAAMFYKTRSCIREGARIGNGSATRGPTPSPVLAHLSRIRLDYPILKYLFCPKQIAKFPSFLPSFRVRKYSAVADIAYFKPQTLNTYLSYLHTYIPIFLPPYLPTYLFSTLYPLPSPLPHISINPPSSSPRLASPSPLHIYPTLHHSLSADGKHCCYR